MSGASLVWGLRLAPLTRQQAVERIAELIENKQPSYLVSANLHYAMLTAETPALAEINRRAALILADGNPLVVASRATPHPVPERVTGSDLIFDLCEMAATRGFRVFLLGGAPGIALEASRRLVALYPGLQVVGTACPDPAEMVEPGVEAVIQQVRDAKPDLLILALTQPKGEIWVDRHIEQLQVPFIAQLGASMDFVAGRVRRAPKFLQKIGMEWAYRIYTDPRRLGPRYWKDARFLMAQIVRGQRQGQADPATPAANRTNEPVSSEEARFSS